MANAITRMITLLNGSFVGQDEFGNKYYHQKKAKAGTRRRRWVIYKENDDDGSRVPPEHNAWLHYTVDDFPTERTNKTWQKPHESNHTGSELAYRPPGHVLEGGKRSKATGDYEAWSPE